MRFPHKYLLGFLLFAFIGCSKDDKKPSTPPPPPVVNTDSTFTNPLLTSGPDPWVTQKDSFYYYTQTSGDRIRIWKTKIMSKLNYSNPVTVWVKPATGPNSQDVWAPELHFLDGKWYLYYTAGSGDNVVSQRLFVLENSSADPTAGTWVDKGQVKDPAADYWAIDANIFDYNGNRYLVWSGHPSNTDFTQNIYIAKMLNPWTLSSSRVQISTPVYPWETQGAPVNEGPEVIINPSGVPVLVFSASGCWTDSYGMGFALLQSNTDPLSATGWVKSSITAFATKADSGAYGPGHCAFFISPDGTENWLVYHANPGANQECRDTRNPRMQKFSWNSDGTPNFGVPVKINTPITKPSGE